VTEFAGFPEDFFSFFTELKKNNNREWFTANKARYHESVVQPMCGYIAAVAPRLKNIAPCYRADPRPHGGSMFRIYRDIRFAKDKTAYKTHAACHFRHQAGRDAHAPGFNLHIETDRVSMGGGIWRPPAKHLGLIREFIADNPAAWEKLRRSTAIKQMGGIKGDSLKRPPRGYDADSRHLEDLKRKSFFLMAETGPELVRSAALVSESARVFRTVARLNHFITDALDLPF
jgi:uncharacterized protein (TIGR02453 family)